MNDDQINEIIKEVTNAIKFYNKLLYSVREVAEILETTVARVNELINEGLLISLKLGDRKITKRHLNEFLDKYEGKDINELLERGK